MTASPVITRFEDLYDVPAGDGIWAREGGVPVWKSEASLETPSGAQAKADAAAAASVPKSTVTTKGDLIVGTGAGTIARLGAGPDGDLLVADSGQTDGVKWSTPAAALGGSIAAIGGAVKAGSVTDTDFTAPADGDVGVNTTESQWTYRSGGAWFGVVPAAQIPNYAIVATAGTAWAVDQTGKICFKSSSRDSGAVLNSCLAALATAAGNPVGEVQLGPQNHDWKTVPQVPRVATGTTPDSGSLTVKGAGRYGGGTKISLSATGKRFLDPGRLNDYDQFAGIEIADLLIDAANMDTANGNQHVVFGGNVDGNSQQRVNVSRVKIRGIRTINVPVGGTGTVIRNVAIVSKHLAGAETQTNLTDILVEDCDFNGGNYGAAVYASVTSGQSAEVFIDQVRFIRVKHDTGVVPSIAAGSKVHANFHIGSVGFGGSCTIRDCVGVNSGDVGVEIDAMTNSYVENVKIVDCRNNAFLTTQFRDSQYPNASSYEWIGCKHYRVSCDTGVSFELELKGGTRIGRVAIRGCRTHITNPTLKSTGVYGGIRGPVANAQVLGELIIEDYKFVWNGLAYDNTGSSLTFSPIATNFITAQTEVTLRDITIEIDGAITGAGAGVPTFALIDLNGLTHLKVDGYSPKVAVTGMTATKLIALRAGNVSGSKIYGTIRGMAPLALGDDTNPRGIVIGSAANLFIGKSDGTTQEELLLDDCDFRGMSAGSEIAFSTTADNRPWVRSRNSKWRTWPRPSAALAAIGSTLPGGAFASSAWTTATANQYLGGEAAEIHFANGTGAGITKIETSRDGVTYEAVWDQSSGAMTQDVLVPVEHGDYLKVTFATTQPTTRVRFRR